MAGCELARELVWAGSTSAAGGVLEMETVGVVVCESAVFRPLMAASSGPGQTNQANTRLGQGWARGALDARSRNTGGWGLGVGGWLGLTTPWRGAATTREGATALASSFASLISAGRQVGCWDAKRNE